MPIKVYMILPDSSEDLVLKQRWAQAEESLLSTGDSFAIDRISQAEVLDLGKTRNYSNEHIFVSSKFEGKAFEHLVNIGCRVYGAPCVLQCLEQRCSLPRRSPIFALLMSKLNICCSGFPRDQRDLMLRYVTWLGGDFKLDLTSDVTHLIADKVGSAKYDAFLELGKPIVRPEWIFNLWSTAECTYPLQDNFAILTLTDYVLPAFAGLTICTSGFRDEERRVLKEKIEKNGGKFTGQLRQNEATHLVIRELSGDKYEAALAWGNVKIVVPQWVIDSDHANCCLPAEKYMLFGPRPPKPGELLRQKQSLSSQKLDVQVNSVNCEPPKRDGDKLCTASPAPFMNSCSIYLFNLSGPAAEEMKKMITVAGGMLVAEALEYVTHVVTTEQFVRDAQDLVMNNCSLAHIVSPDWVRQSYCSLKILSESDFDLTKIKDIAEISSNDTDNKCNLQSNITILAENTIAISDDMGEISSTEIVLNNSRPPNHSLNRSGCLRRIVLDGFSPRTDRLNEVTSVLNKIDCEISLIHSTIQCNAVDLLVVAFGHEPSQHANRLMQTGVRSVNSLFIVETLKCYLDKLHRAHKNNLAVLHPKTINKLLGDSLNSLMADPLVRTVHPMIKCLADCCITLTGFQPPERSILVRLVVALGAAHQENFSRTDTNTKSMYLQKSTHLIAATPLGEKFEKAKQWGVPAMKKDWLLECWRTGVRVPEEGHMLLNMPFNKTLEETIYQVNKSVRKSEVDDEDIAKASQIMQTQSGIVATPQTFKNVVDPPPPPIDDHRDDIAKRLQAILGKSKPAENSRPRTSSRPSPEKTPKTPSLNHENANFVAPSRPAIHYVGVESSQSLQVGWGDDSGTSRFSSNCERIDEEPSQPGLANSRLRSLTLAEDALSSPNTSIMNDVSGHPKCSPLLNTNSNSELPLARAPDAVVIRSSAAFPFDRKTASVGGETNITRSALTPPVFQFTGLNANERDDAADLFERLGARVAATPSTTMGEGNAASLSDSPLEASCTHLIVAEPSRTQKYLSGIASGKWILHRSYIEACRRNGHLVDESPHEWGSDRCPPPPPSACKGDANLAKRLAAAAHRWRLRLNGSTRKAFSDWRVILLVGHPTAELSFKQILIAGGATIVQLPPDGSPPSGSTFTHWLVEPSIGQTLIQTANQPSLPGRPSRHLQLRRSFECLMKFIAANGGPENSYGGACVVRHDYLQSFLLDDPPPDARKNLISIQSLQQVQTTLQNLAPSASHASLSPARKQPSSVLAQNNQAIDLDAYNHADKRLRTAAYSSSRPTK